jgi:hypothetical protein
MTKTSLLFLGTLALAAAAFASPKSYEILLTAPAQAGNVQLAAGQYHLRLNGSDAIFTSVDTNHSFVASVKVATTQKHEVTAVETHSDAGSQRISSIDLGGTTETLEFGE